MNRFFISFKYAWKGIRTAVAEQRNLKFHFCAAFVAVIAGFYFGINEIEWLLITLAAGFVIAAELINTSIEQLVNMVSPKHQSTAGKIKDIAAGAVLAAAVTSAVIGVIIFGKYVFG